VAGYGHTHNYVVVPTNRWEDVARGQAGQNRPSERANLGSTLANWRNASPRRGAFTGPAAPTLNSAASPTASGSTRATTLNWTPAGWNGSGPAANATRWHPVFRMSNHSADQTMPVVNAGANPTAAVSTVHAAAGMQPGRWYDYAVSGENAAGRGPQSNMNIANGTRTWVRNWQRPANPVASAATASGIPNNTRAIDVRGSLAATADESYAATAFSMRQATRGGNDASPTGWQTQNAQGHFRFDRINHNSTRRFEVRVQGNGGFSDVVTVSGRTDLLAAGRPTITATTTRRIAANFSATNGNNRQLILEGGLIHSGSRTVTGTSADWTAIGDGRAYTVRSRNTDGHNIVRSARGASTPRVHVGIRGRHGDHPTRELCLNAWSNNATVTDVHIYGARVGTNDGCHNTLTHNTRFGMVGTASDGVNVRQASGAGTTMRLYPPARPTCSVWTSINRVGGTIRWSSNGSLNRTQVTNASAGWHEATATATISDGWPPNTQTSESRCGVRIWPLPGASSQPSCSVTDPAMIRSLDWNAVLHASRNLFSGTNGVFPWQMSQIRLQNQPMGGRADASSWWQFSSVVEQVGNGQTLFRHGGMCRGTRVSTFQWVNGDGIWNAGGRPTIDGSTPMQFWFSVR